MLFLVFIPATGDSNRRLLRGWLSGHGPPWSVFVLTAPSVFKELLVNTYFQGLKYIIPHLPCLLGPAVLLIFLTL